MVSSRPNGRTIGENWVRSGVHRSLKHPNPRGKSGQYRLPTDPQKWGNGKIPRAAGRYSGCPKELADIQGSLLPSLQALPDLQESNRCFPWIWCVSKPYLGSRIPGDDFVYTVSTSKWNKGRQIGNGKPQKHQYETIQES